MTVSQRNKRPGQLNFLIGDNSNKASLNQNSSNRIVNFLSKETSIVAKTDKVGSRRQNKRFISSEQSGSRSPFTSKRLIKKLAPTKD